MPPHTSLCPTTCLRLLHRRRMPIAAPSPSSPSIVDGEGVVPAIGSTSTRCFHTSTGLTPPPTFMSCHSVSPHGRIWGRRGRKPPPMWVREKGARATCMGDLVILGDEPYKASTFKNRFSEANTLNRLPPKIYIFGGSCFKNVSSVSKLINRGRQK